MTMRNVLEKKCRFPEFYSDGEFGAATDWLTRRIIVTALAKSLLVFGSILLWFGTACVADAAVYYVNANSASPSSPYTSWSQAARTIQDAVDVASPGDEIVVTNGAYATGGRTVDGTITNRVTVTKALTVRSANGPAVTFIRGGTMRCAYLINGASLSGFTLTNGFAVAGGGVWCESTRVMISNCVLVGNSASLFGGGAYSGTLNDCTLKNNAVVLGGIGGGGAIGSDLIRCVLVGNTHRDDCGDDVCGSGGGGALSCNLNECLLTGNSTDYHGGGVFDCLVQNSTLTGNLAGYAGGGAVGGSLSNCFVADNRAGYEGGGSYYSTVSRTIFLRNRGGQYGGGVAGGSVVNSLIVSNSAIYFGGGSYHGWLTNCTVALNFTTDPSGRGGGIIGNSAENCIVYFNRAEGSETNHSGALLNRSCTIPMPTNGLANLTNNPVFAELSRGDFRLSEVSPCIDPASGDSSAGGADLDGRPRLIGARIDIGAFEFQGAATNQLVRWLRQNGLPADGSADGTDNDGDRSTNFQEWRAGTNPTNPASVLQFLTPVKTSAGTMVSWKSVAGRTYSLERSTDVMGLAFLPWLDRITGQFGTTSRIDTNNNAPGVFIYRVRVEE